MNYCMYCGASLATSETKCNCYRNSTMTANTNQPDGYDFAGLVAALRSQKQADECGELCTISRQAADEAAEWIERFALASRPSAGWTPKYGLLEVGEVIRESDEVFNTETQEWQSLLLRDFGQAAGIDDNPIRRRIDAAPSASPSGAEDARGALERTEDRLLTLVNAMKRSGIDILTASDWTESERAAIDAAMSQPSGASGGEAGNG